MGSDSKTQIPWRLLGLPVMFLLACSSAPTRNPSSSDDSLETLLMRHAALKAEFARETDERKLTGREPTDHLEKQKLLTELHARILRLAPPSQEEPAAITVPYLASEGLSAMPLYIDSLPAFRAKDGQPERVVPLPLWSSREHRVELVNRATEEPLQARLSCDGEFTVSRSGPATDLREKREARFELYNADLNGQRVFFTPGPSIRQCTLLLQDSRSPKETYGARFVREDELHPLAPRLLSASQACFLPQAPGDGPRSLFLTPDYDHMTCPAEVERIVPLDDPLDAFTTKLELLLGYRLPTTALERQDPFIELDFSRAPKLDAILISYLVFRADFSGTLLSRILKWHADRGTMVKILVSDVISLEKDKAMLRKLAASSPNIQLSEFRYNSPRTLSVRDRFAELHRTMHVKLLITLSESDPSRNAVVLGGRNIHDAFVFKEPKSHAKWKDVVDYVAGDEAFVHWKDFEVKITSPDFARTMAQHYFTLWTQDAETFLVRSLNSNFTLPTQAPPSYFTAAKGPLIRHFLSIPYKDGGRLEDFYVELFDSARKTLHLSTPYFHLTPRLGDAVRRAVDRGVEVTLITRIELDGDTADIVLSDVNKAAINRFLDQITIYEFITPKTILHSKLVLIDGELSFMGGVNLNKRSFLHDTESGILVHSPEFARTLERLYESYKTECRPIREEQKTVIWKQLLIRAFQDAL
ncbi:MAG: phosphatidylserine/phosphatidylglycerophosphate/cardiolipin synthase family protein [Oligoflexia bacterium]|nr:phosphatidylserine/phosphatidylglycerophosphate/cardiolipin synthase family protein [Oligoflexia bacterium]